MTDPEINSAFQKLLNLHCTAGEAVAQFAAAGAIRQVILRPGSEIFSAYESRARETRDAVERLGDPKATALMDEILSLTHRMIQLEASLPPARPYPRDLKKRALAKRHILVAQADDSATALSSRELNLAGIRLYLGSGTLWNYLSRMFPPPEIHPNKLYVLSQPELMKWCKWNGAASDADIEVVIDKVTQYLSEALPG